MNSQAEMTNKRLNNLTIIFTLLFSVFNAASISADSQVEDSCKYRKTKVCYNGNVYWYDNCKSDYLSMKEYCGIYMDCVDGSCVCKRKYMKKRGICQSATAYSEPGIRPGFYSSINRVFDNRINQDVINIFTHMSLMADRAPPVVEEVSISPEHPVSEETISISAVIHGGLNEPVDVVKSAQIFFSADNCETWQTVDMEFENDKAWRGEIPGHESGAEIHWGIRASDNLGNIYIDVPCAASEPIEEMEYPACEDHLSSTECVHAIPEGAMVPAAIDDEPINDQETAISDDMDIVRFHFGRTRDSLLFDLKVEGEVSPGKFSRDDTHGYSIFMLNQNYEMRDQKLDDFTNGILLIYAPLMESFGAMLGGVNESCVLFYSSGGNSKFKLMEEFCYQYEDRLVFSISEDFIHDTGVGFAENQYLFFAVTSSVVSILDYQEQLLDFTRVTRANIKERVIRIE